MVMYHLRIFAVTSGHDRLTPDPMVIQVNLTDINEGLEEIQRAVRDQLIDFVPAWQEIALGFTENVTIQQPISLIRNQEDMRNYLNSLNTDDHRERVMAVLDTPTREERRETLGVRYRAAFGSDVNEVGVNANQMNGILVHRLETSVLRAERMNRVEAVQDSPPHPAEGAGGESLDHQFSHLLLFV